MHLTGNIPLQEVPNCLHLAVTVVVQLTLLNVIFTGDDRNILQVYVAGRPVAGTTLISSHFSCKRKPGIDIEFHH